MVRAATPARIVCRAGLITSRVPIVNCWVHIFITASALNSKLDANVAERSCKGSKTVGHTSCITIYFADSVVCACVICCWITIEEANHGTGRVGQEVSETTLVVVAREDMGSYDL